MLTTDLSKIYRAFKLTQSNRDYHCLIWQRNRTKSLMDYRMTRLTFSASASSFAAKMAVKQNAMDFTLQYPLATQKVYKAFYVDNSLTGAESITEAIHLTKVDLYSENGIAMNPKF